jgi:hypothetical protein
MNLQSKMGSRITLAIAALVVSRGMFSMFDDPEGPNLLIVVVAALVIYFVSQGVYSLLPLTWRENSGKVFTLIALQGAVAFSLYVCLLFTPGW